MDRDRLTELQRRVTQQGETEDAFSSELLLMNDKGIYCCVTCGEELFDSTVKYDSGTGWPAFTHPILETALDETPKGKNKTEVKCSVCGAHLGHVFTRSLSKGKRYCINGSALVFNGT